MVSRLCLLLVVAWAVQATDYCEFTYQHTMCRYKGRGPRCGPVVGTNGVSMKDAELIVELHNKLRSTVAQGQEWRGAFGSQPAGSNIRALVWDEELATVAQRHADQCVFNHDCSDCRRVERFPVGQNLYTHMTTGRGEYEPDWRAAIYAWYNEVKDFPASNIQPFRFSSGTGHYTQMLWASTSHIGCGFTTYRNGKWMTGLFTCNYGPAGNYINGQMYARGKPCSSCPADTTCWGRCGLCNQY